MESVRPERAYRIVMRRRTGQEYLQPSGAWSDNRETARVFESSSFTYHRARKHRLLVIDVRTAVDAVQRDFVTMKT